MTHNAPKSGALLGFVALVWCVCGISSGQEKPSPPERVGTVPADTAEDRSVTELPKIDLPEFVITGKETIDLPEFSKTTIDDQRAYDLASRKPDLARREAARAELGKSTKEQGGFAGGGKRPDGKVTAGFGSYRTPFFDGWFGRDAGEFDFLVKGGYKSSRGYAPNTDFREGHASVSGGTYLPHDIGILSGNRVHGSIGFQGNGYRLYGSRVGNRWRTIRRLMIDVSTSSQAHERFTYAGGLYLRSAWMNDSIATGGTAFGLEYSATRAIGEIDVKGDLGLWTDLYDAPTALANPLFGQAGLSGRFRLGGQWDFVGGLMFYLVRGSDTKTTGYLYPRASASWYANPWLTVFARFEPYIQRNSLSAIVEECPYVVSNVPVRHQRYFTSFSFGAEADVAKSVTTKLWLNVRQARDYPLYVDTSSSGLWDIEHSGTTRIISLEGDLYADITANDHVAVSLVARTSTNSIMDKEAPYFPSSVLSGLYQHRFPWRLALGTTMKLIGRQFTDLGNTASLPAFFLLDFKADYVVVPQFTVSFAVHNILGQDQTWWKNYRGQPRAAVLGMSFTW